MSHQIEVWLLCDSDGNHVCSPDKDELAQLYEDSIGTDHALARRVLKLVVDVAVEPHVTLRGEAPAEGEASLVVLEDDGQAE